MYLPRRLTAIVLNVLLFQVVWTGYGATCVQPVAAPVNQTADVSHRPERACADAAPAGGGCSVPSAPEQCVTTTACVVLALPMTTDATTAEPAPKDRGWSDVLFARPAPRPAPDLPPPRA